MDPPMTHHPIRRGLDLPIAGAATGAVIPLPPPATVSLDPRELRGFLPRVAAREGERVLAGTPLLTHKFDPRIAIVSPVSGVVKAIQRGPRRVIEAVVVEPDGQDAAVALRAFSLAELAGLDRETARDALVRLGAWVQLRTRPLDRLAEVDAVPQSILVAATDSGPLAPGADVLLGADDRDALQAAVHAFRALTDGKVYLTHAEGASHPAWSGLQGVEVHTFSGPHPSGDPGVQINHVDPPRGVSRVLYLRAWDAVAIGRGLLAGRVDGTRVYAAVGAGLRQPRFVRTLLGAPLAHVAGAVVAGPVRWIRGSVLTGTRAAPTDGTGFFSRTVHVLPDDVQRELLGWAAPQLGRWSFHRAFLQGWGRPSQPVDLRPGLFGGHRAIVPTGVHEKVVATPDVLPTFLFKAILAGDIEGSLKLGLLDITEEEAALISFVDPSKIDWDVILREGLEAYVKEA
jgi:Na+-transporting NADH:ubiquinone oxidoreductase subunit A